MALRRDVHAPNESDGFVFTSAAQRGRGLSAGDAGWDEAVAAGALMPLAVESEDSAIIRVVLGDALRADERDEWVGRAFGRLALADGRLVLCGGIAYVLEKAAWTDEYAREVSVPPGTYRATVYCYASAPNGRECVERSGSKEPLGAWFRRTRPGQEMPVWLHNLCVHDPSVDPGHEKTWKRARMKRGGAVVDLLLHLEADGAGPVTPFGEQGFMEAGECRRPAPFPMGVPAVDVEGGEEEAAEAVAPPVVTPVVPAPAEGAKRAPIEGGPVAVPVAKLARLARLAWMCQPYTRPVVRVRFPSTAPPLEDVEDADLTTEGNDLTVTFADNGQAAEALAAMVAIGKQLARVADGAVIEMDLAPKKRSPRREGVHRYRGPVRAGAWEVAESFPSVAAARLTEALALAEAMENGRRLTARDEADALAIEARVRSTCADLFGANELQRTGAEIALKRRDPALFDQVVWRVFWMRYADTWPLRDGDRE